MENLIEWKFPFQFLMVSVCYLVLLSETVGQEARVVVAL